ncbi:MAG: DUF3316 domain-containing protein [Mediterranea sp.]|jgi:hypothetical protein|nr:DUF3316 domain-containing protein [Mediterranea sp.]
MARFRTFICLLAFPVMLYAQADSLENHRYITRVMSYGVGQANVYDNYLSPQEYKGIDFRISRETIRMTNMFDGNVSVQNFFQTNLSYIHNRANNNNTFAGLINWNYGWHYQFHISESFKVLAGGLGDFNGGFVYNLRNTNNPASARAYINLAASGMLIWRTKIKSLPLIVRYQANVPVAGVLFSPNYGQSYYEIFTLGNWSGVINFTSLHNQPSIRQFFTVDVPISRSRFRFSYLWDVQQSRVNRLKTHTYGYVFMVGVVRDLYRIRNKNSELPQPAIRAY